MDQAEMPGRAEEASGREQREVGAPDRSGRPGQQGRCCQSGEQRTVEDQ